MKDLVEAWRSKHLIVNRRPSYAKRAPRAIELTFESLLKRPATAITADEARKARIAAEDKRGVAAARFAAAALIAAYHWAVAQGRLKASPIDGLALPSATPGRDRVLTVAEIRRVWAAACRLPYPGGPFVRLLMLTGARRSEIAGLKRAEIVEGDTGLKTIELGPERTKTDARHVIPLADAALDVLAACPRFSGCEYVFSSDGWRGINNFDRLKLALDAEIAADGGAAHALLGVPRPPAHDSHPPERRGFQRRRGFRSDSPGQAARPSTGEAARHGGAVQPSGVSSGAAAGACRLGGFCRA